MFGIFQGLSAFAQLHLRVCWLEAGFLTISPCLSAIRKKFSKIYYRPSMTPSACALFTHLILKTTSYQDPVIIILWDSLWDRSTEAKCGFSLTPSPGLTSMLLHFRLAAGEMGCYRRGVWRAGRKETWPVVRKLEGENLTLQEFKIQHPVHYSPQNSSVQTSRQTVDFQQKIIVLTVLCSVISDD